MLANCRRLVLGCIEAEFCAQISICSILRRCIHFAAAPNPVAKWLHVAFSMELYAGQTIGIPAERHTVHPGANEPPRRLGEFLMLSQLSTFTSLFVLKCFAAKPAVPQSFSCETLDRMRAKFIFFVVERNVAASRDVRRVPVHRQPAERQPGFLAEQRRVRRRRYEVDASCSV